MDWDIEVSFDNSKPALFDDMEPDKILALGRQEDSYICLVSYRKKGRAPMWIPLACIIGNYPELWLEYNLNPEVTGSHQYSNWVPSHLKNIAKSEKKTLLQQASQFYMLFGQVKVQIVVGSIFEHKTEAILNFVDMESLQQNMIFKREVQVRQEFDLLSKEVDETGRCVITSTGSLSNC